MNPVIEIDFGSNKDPAVLCHPLPIKCVDNEVLNVTLGGKIFHVKRCELYDFMDVIWRTLVIITENYDLKKKEN